MSPGLCLSSATAAATHYYIEPRFDWISALLPIIALCATVHVFRVAWKWWEWDGKHWNWVGP